VAGRLVSGKNTNSVYDYGAGKHWTVTGTVSGSSINVYDFDRRCHISGSGGAKQWNLYDFGRAAHISLKIESNGRFSGYDYATGTFYNGSVTGQSVTLYDSGTAKYYNFTV
jgi:hypothetical protein